MVDEKKITDLSKQKEFLLEKVHFYREVVNKTHAFLHLTDIATGALLWHNRSPMLLFAQAYPELQHCLESQLNELFTLDNFRQLALAQRTKIQKGQPFVEREKYKIPTGFDLPFQCYETISVVSGNAILGVSLDFTQSLHTKEALHILLKENAKMKDKIKAAQLTNSEKEVAKLILAGISTAEMAKTLNKSASTIESHRKNIYSKMGCNNMVELSKMLIDIL